VILEFYSKLCGAFNAFSVVLFSFSLYFFVCLLHFMRNKLRVDLIRTMSPRIFRDGTAH